MITDWFHPLGLAGLEDIIGVHLAFDHSALNLVVLELKLAMLLEEVWITLDADGITIPVAAVTGPTMAVPGIQEGAPVVAMATVEESPLELLIIHSVMMANVMRV
jgi:hypothetical protein